jgi:hypothetical protein
VAEPQNQFAPFESSLKDRWIPALLFACLLIFVLAVQNHNVGFEPGHHGWVTSHTLAIISHATSDHGFVGYSVQLKDAQGKIEYDYFDRNPVFFSALMNLLLESSERSLSQRVYLARQVMNAIFLATILVVFLLLRELLRDTINAISATLMTFSGYYYMYYKDMVHFEQPALLGLILLLYAILRYKRAQDRKFLYLSAAFAVSFGMGYLSLVVLGLWSGIEFLTIFGANRFNPVAAARLLFKAEAFKVMVLGLGLSACYLSYNVLREAHLRGVSVGETSIVESATRRLGLKPRVRTTGRVPTDWNVYAPMTAKRLVKSAVPYAAAWGLKQRVDKSTFENAAIPAITAIGLMAVLIILHCRQGSSTDRSFYVLLVFSGFAWLIPMRYHAAPHDYTAMYFAGLLMVFFSALITRLLMSLRIAALVIAVAVFVTSNFVVNADQLQVAASDNAYTYDFERILDRLRSRDQVYVDGGHENLLYGRPYALGFYLSDQYITPLAIADYAVSADRNFRPQTMTPQNQAIFLFRVNERQESFQSGK